MSVAAPATRFTREAIVRLGRSAPPWEFLPVGLRALEIAPADAELRILAAAHLARLGLRTLALEHLEFLPPETGPAHGPAAGQVLDACRALPDDRIDIAQLATTCEANLRTLAELHALDLRPALDSWRWQAAGDQWFRAADGNIVRRRPGPAAWEWIAFGDSRGAAMRFAAQHLAPLPGAPPRTPESMYTLEGLSPPWLFEQLLRHTPFQKDGFWTRIALIQADVAEFLDALAIADLRAALREPRLSVFVGAGAAESFAAFLERQSQRGATIAGPYIPLASLRTRLEPSVPALLHHAQSEESLRREGLAEEVRRIYSGRDSAYWRQRYDEALPVGGMPSRPLRILIPTTRYSTYIQHSSADLAQAMTIAGMDARVLIEPDTHSRLSAAAYLSIIGEFQPDLIVLINYFRPVEGYIPAEVPFVCWIQDALPHQFDARAGCRQGPLDFIVGHLHPELFSTYGFPRQRTLAFPVVVSAAKFHAAPAAHETPDRHPPDRHHCDVAFVSHHSETPRRMHERLVQEAADPAIARLLEDLFPIVHATGQNAMGARPQRAQLEEAIAEALRRHTGREPQPGRITSLLHQYALPLAERVLRHQTLEWVAEIAERRRWRFHLYGRGWETHERLAPFARGVAAHGDELREIYRSAAITLHISIAALVHQRIMECALSGGLPLCRLTREELQTISSAARRRSMGESPSTPAHQACALADRRWGLRTADSPQLLAMAALLQRLGEPAEAFFWSPPLPPESLLPENLMSFERRADWLFGDLSEVSFRGPEELETAIERAISRPAWRQSMSDWIASRVRQRLTFEPFITQVLGLIRTSLADTAPKEQAPCQHH
jgi:hypothetical protein